MALRRVGVGIVGPLRKAPGGYTHLRIAIYKFSKWVEVRPTTNLRAEQAVTFFTDNSPNSRAEGSWSSMTSSTSASIGRPWHIHRPTVKWSEPTA
jgi:hypothetical protein